MQTAIAAPARRWALPALAAFAVYLALVTARVGDPVDLAQLAQPLHALLGGHLAAVYLPHGPLTSPPGFLLLAAPVVAALGGHLMAGRCWEVVGALAALSVPVCALRLQRAVRPDAPAAVSAAVAGGTLLLAPFVFAVKVDFHPEDLAAVAFLLVAVERGVRRDRVGTGLALAAVLLTRQWGLLAAGPLLAAQGRDWWRSAAVTAAACAAVLAPFAVASPAGLLHALLAPDVVSAGGNALLAHLALPVRVRYATARLAPLGGCVPVVGVLAWRWRGPAPPAVAVVGACLAAVTLRMVFETDSLDYYLAPTVALAVVAAACCGRRLRPLLVGPLAVMEVVLLAEPALAASSAPYTAAAMFACYLACVVAGLRLATAPAPDGTAPALRSPRAQRGRRGASSACPSG